MSDDVSFLPNFRVDTLYVIPGSQGAYGKFVSENEIPIAEVEVTTRSRLAVSAFFVDSKDDYDSFRITKLKFHATFGWQEDGHVQINRFAISRMKAFIAVLSSLNLRDSKKARISLGSIEVEALGSLLATADGTRLLRDLSETPELVKDVYALAAKREVLESFKSYLESDLNEQGWQAFFEANPWIFGHGLKYVFLDKVGRKFESVTTGSEFDHPGKRVDALMRTRAEVSQYVLIEIKRGSTELVKTDAYRPGVWAVSNEVSGGVSQIQKTAFEFARTRFHTLLKTPDGGDLSDSIYSIEPKAVLVVGSLSSLATYEDKIACFELYRRNIRSPEIVTFDELFHRAKHIVANLGDQYEPGSSSTSSAP